VSHLHKESDSINLLQFISFQELKTIALKKKILSREVALVVAALSTPLALGAEDQVEEILVWGSAQS
jgi:hypothetical protein